ncbi:hypothetical protein GCM10010269_57510 [Streptomyces humidus]|uniref:Tat pathway signal sequence domain protein n=1 Tax=Streptomyces humidus TaxID=52259 RepID=A0A918G0U2_9ACTN|nr:hypothetical protein GCM10010269_57510 [Streptomyces humidus]
MLWGAAVAAVGTAAMTAVTLPSDATGADRPGRTDGAYRSTQSGTPAPGDRAGAATAERPAPAGEQRTGRGPLTETEVDRAKALALGPGRMPGARDVSGRKGPEYLDTELAESAVPSGDEARRVDVLFYDYGSDQLVKKTVDLTSGTVESTRTAGGVQPPPSADETIRAAELLIRSGLGAGLRKDFKAAARGRELTGAAQLTLQGISYNTAEQSGPASLAACGRHRCVRLFTRVKGGPWIDTTDLVIDLSDGSVRRIHA